MTRIRTIKPEFFRHDGLAELEPLTRLLFIGLWTIADREGRLEYRPKRIKVELLPYDEADVERMISDLSEHGFIECYESNNTNYIQVTNFSKHQHCNIKEPASTMPAPPQHHTSTVQAPSQHAGKGKERKGMEVEEGCARARASTSSTKTPPPPPIFNINSQKPSDEERTAWGLLVAIPDYPDSESAFLHLRELISEFPGLSAVSVIKSWRDYLAGAKNGKSLPTLSGLRTQFQTAASDPKLKKRFSKVSGGAAARVGGAVKPKWEPCEVIPQTVENAMVFDRFEGEMRRIKAEQDPQYYEAMFAPMRFVGMSGADAVIAVPSTYHANALRSSIGEVLSKALGCDLVWALEPEPVEA